MFCPTNWGRMLLKKRTPAAKYALAAAWSSGSTAQPGIQFVGSSPPTSAVLAIVPAWK
jgi:hypothetical protein